MDLSTVLTRGIVVALSVPLLLSCDAKHENSDHVTQNVGGVSGELIVEEDMFDFGVVLGNDGILEHGFFLHNPSSERVLIRKAWAHTPCCSLLGKMDNEVPPNGSLRVPAFLKIGSRTGPKLARFSLLPDGDVGPAITFVLVADVIADWEVEPPDPRIVVAPGVEPTLSIELRSRGRDGEGVTLPETVSADDRLTACFEGPIHEREIRGGIQERSRLVRVGLRHKGLEGTSRAWLRFHWPDGRHRDQPIDWVSTPHVRALPTGLIIRPGEATRRKLSISSGDGKAFQIRGVEGEGIAIRGGASEAPAVTHVVEVDIDPHALPASGAVDRWVLIDHPEQPSVTITIIKAGYETGGDP